MYLTCKLYYIFFFSLSFFIPRYYEGKNNIYGWQEGESKRETQGIERRKTMGKGEGKKTKGRKERVTPWKKNNKKG